MMNDTQIEHVLKRVQYKRDVTITLNRSVGNPDQIDLLLVACAVDATGRQGAITVHNRRVFRRPYDEREMLKHCVFELIKQYEMHELYEFFKLDGVCVFEPHPELAR